METVTTKYVLEDLKLFHQFWAEIGASQGVGLLARRENTLAGDSRGLQGHNVERDAVEVRILKLVDLSCGESL